MKSGFIAILGRPNAGKSTLINSIMKEKIAITTQKAQTTRNAILGILNDEDSQIVFIDTPGIHEAKTALGAYMNREALSQAEGVDIIYYIVDGTKGLQSEDKQILERVFSYGAPVFLLVNKIDEISSDLLIRRLTYASDNYSFAEIIPISALKKDNIDELIATSKGYLTDSVQYYPEDVKTNMNRDFRISEIIREKILMYLQDEVPHGVAVEIEEFVEEDTLTRISAVIYCERKSHKGMIIGKNGRKLKGIGKSAREEIEGLLGTKVFLQTWVKVKENWRDSDIALSNFGYKEQS